MVFSEQMEKAIALAAQAHEGQYRRNQNIVPSIPYSSHCYNVGFMLFRMGYGEDIVIAGILHDIVEDTSITLDFIEEQFGKGVAAIVEMVTDEPDLAFKERKTQQFEMIRNAPEGVKAIKAADSLHNMYSRVFALRRGENIWQNIPDQRKEESLWGYHESLKALRTGWDHEILDELESYLNELESLSVNFEERA